MPLCTKPYIRSKNIGLYTMLLSTWGLLELYGQLTSYPFHQGKQRGVVAVKCIKRSHLTHSSMENLLTEIKVMKQLQHEHIVHLVEFEVSKWSFPQCWCLILSTNRGLTPYGFIKVYRNRPLLPVSQRVLSPTYTRQHCCWKQSCRKHPMYDHHGASNNVAEPMSIRSNIVAGPIMTIHWVFPATFLPSVCWA